ncbi:SNF2 family N-terminal domain-containing protein [Hypomontagnella monticulosa]|nr:SNF2 family N-terminal domain-containing protein [Hypomontagnella monticulosa]
MGRPHHPLASGLAPHRQKGPIRVQRVRSSDPIPVSFLGFLYSLPPDTTDQSDSEPPRKRARIEHVKNVENIPIARTSLTFKRPTQHQIPINDQVSFTNVQRNVKVHYRELEHVLAVSSQSRSPYGAFKLELDLGHLKLSDEALETLIVASRSRDDDDKEGSLWVRVAVELEGGDDGKDHLRFHLELNWNTSTYSLRSPSQRSISQKILNTFFGNTTSRQSGVDEKLSPQAFYDAAFVPAKDHTNSLPPSAPRLTSKLYPFQRRSLQWLLKREGVKWSDCLANGEPGLEPCSSLATDLPLSFRTVEDTDGRSFYVSDLYHIVTRDITPFRESEAIKGGILAEEMGLGKTPETISLICMHTRKGLPQPPVDAAQDVRPSGATLIVTPSTLKNQWLFEFNKHAPDLRVKVYDGLKGISAKDDELVPQLAEFDVIITTYNVLQAEIHYAEEPPSRSMRNPRKYRRPKSPLVRIHWWRICLDEAQQVESGVSSAARLATLIPRVNSWGITGTPVKENVKDLWGLLVFLRYEPFASSTAIWDGLITTHKHLFKPLFNRLSLRHTKRAIRDELRLPPQKRYVMTIPFTTIEEQHYQTRFKQLTQSFGLDENGAPLQEDWDPEDPYIIDLMKRALAQLRRSIMHPSLGIGRFLLHGDQRDKTLRTIDEVLDMMIDQSDASIRTDQRNHLVLKLERGQILENQSKIPAAIKLWQEVVDEAIVLTEECRGQLRTEIEEAKRAGADGSIGGGDSNDAQSENFEDEKVTGKVTECRRRLRYMLDIHHRAVFFIASGYFQMKSEVEERAPDSEEFRSLEEKEVHGYETAKKIRQEMLQDAREKATSLIAKILEKAKTQSFAEIPEIEFPEFHGIESRRALDNFQMLGEALNEQANLIDEWREAIIQMLSQRLVDGENDEEITGEEYENSTKIQDDLMVYTLALRAAIADRQDAISGLENERIKYDTRYAERQAREGEGHAPEKVLMLLEKRHQVKPSSSGTSVRGVITDLRELATKLRYEASTGSNRARVELEIVERQLRLTQEQSTAQNKVAAALERELDSFVTIMNARVEYYKQLQAISDTVVPLDIERVGDLDEALVKLLSNEATVQKRINGALPKHRYLVHLKEKGQNTVETCVICQSTFTQGVLTVCGHQFCKECIMSWFKMSRTCPVCKKYLSHNMLHDITLKKQKLKFHQEHPHDQSQLPGEASSPSKSKKFGIYSEFGSEKLEAIKSIDLHGPSFGTKIDMIAQQLMWLRVEDPGAKSVIFSQFGGFLDILSRAFDQYSIGYSSFKMRDGIKKFKEDPAIECFLMDARAHASGLNLVNASHVILCEPVLNTALELQAIARVDRIGQEHETTVWLYLIDGTVEESIYNLSVQRRLEHLGKNTQDPKGKSKEPTPEMSDLTLEEANSMELQQAGASLSKLLNRDQNLGEVVDKNDLWQCLFGHVAKVQASTDERINDPAVIRFLAGEAAEDRRAS